MKKILLVDDSTSIRNILKGSLVHMYQVIEAADGKDALQLADKESADMVLLDVNMPIMDGISTLGHLKEHPHYKNVPIIMLTTETKDELRQEAKQKGAAGWIIKPCQPEKLLSVISQILQ